MYKSRFLGKKSAVFDLKDDLLADGIAGYDYKQLMLVMDTRKLRVILVKKENKELVGYKFYIESRWSTVLPPYFSQESLTDYGKNEFMA